MGSPRLSRPLRQVCRTRPCEREPNFRARLQPCHGPIHRNHSARCCSGDSPGRASPRAGSDELQGMHGGSRGTRAGDQRAGPGSAGAFAADRTRTRTGRPRLPRAQQRQPRAFGCAPATAGRAAPRDRGAASAGTTCRGRGATAAARDPAGCRHYRLRPRGLLGQRGPAAEQYGAAPDGAAWTVHDARRRAELPLNHARPSGNAPSQMGTVRTQARYAGRAQ
jgi:hypothetical protein